MSSSAGSSLSLLESSGDSGPPEISKGFPDAEECPGEVLEICKKTVSGRSSYFCRRNMRCGGFVL